MISNNRWKIAIAVILNLIIFIPIVQAEQPYDITSCHSGTIKVLYGDKEMTILSGEAWGIIMSNHENKVFDNCTFHLMAIIQVMGEQTT